MKVLGVRRPGPADLMTIANAACGAIAVLVVVGYGTRPAGDLADSGIRAVTILLLVGTIFDTLDGAFARGGRGTPLGPMLDSLADALSFGVAPAVLLAAIGIRGADPLEQALVGLGAITYVAAALLRLADFSSGRHENADFTGLPSPLAAGLAVAVAFLSDSPYVIAAGLVLVGYLMVSPLAYPKQRGPVIGAAFAAWTFGIAGSLGLYDVRIGAAVIIVVIGVLLPALPAITARERPRVEDAV